ncbi:lytic transglycosylase domain-containing protein [Chelativorans intermedius]|uniref:Lytic transglycosylase domain-containing protein n=1 Tax=Chelativorans intermedius TaxID=515947 RepID=A0ABV6D839_9HYPH|nr:transglycosylase SLT domain-containing protein [Chelativorans intermedius]MCT8996866.1 transglycosylase SLT domain-containing protein [Chelativorans intermedius]
MSTKIFAAAAFAVVMSACGAEAANRVERGPSGDAETASAENASLAPLLKKIIRGGKSPAEDEEVDDIKTASIGAARGADAGKKKAAERPPFHDIVSRYASKYGVPEDLAHAVISVESNYRPNARGRAGEVGLMQIKPATARGLGYRGSVKALYEPETNIKYGMKYLAGAYELGGGDTCGTILRYNAGHGAKRMNPVSSAYCAKVKRILAGK